MSADFSSGRDQESPMDDSSGRDQESPMDEEEYRSLLVKDNHTFSEDIPNRLFSPNKSRLVLLLLSAICASTTLGFVLTRTQHVSTSKIEWYSTEDCDLTSSMLTSSSGVTQFLAETAFYDGREEPSFVPINQLRSTTVSKRRKQWNEYLSLSSKCEFHPVEDTSQSSEGSSSSPLRRDLCNIQDVETKTDVYWTIERYGPFKTTGGYSSNFVFVGDKTLSAPEWTQGKDLYVIGGAVHPVDAKTLETIAYPPIHIHHAHIYPYDLRTAETVMVVKNIHTWKDSHPVMIQAHGDTACTEEEGGEACLLKTLPDGHGYRVSNFQGSFAVDFDTNDVRINDNSTEPIEYYMQLAVKWTLQEQIPTTFMSFQNPITHPPPGPCRGEHSIPSTYKYEREKAAVLYFNYTNEFLGSGRILLDSLVLHSHQSLFDSLWLFKGDDVYAALESYRAASGENNLPIKREGSLDMLLEEKKRIIRHLKTNVDISSNQLLCEVPAPSLACKRSHSHFDRKEIPELLYDRRVQMYCQTKGDIKLDANETLTVVAFNLAEPPETSMGPTWGTEESPPRQDEGTQSNNTNQCLNTAEQHTIIRGDFVRDDATTLEKSSWSWRKDLEMNKFAPPSYFGWQSWPSGEVEGFVTSKLEWH